MYRFKYYYVDGMHEFSLINTDTPKKLYNDFDGLIGWEKLYSFDEKSVATKEILEVAVRAYTGFLPEFYQTEIINDKINDIVDYIDLREVKENGKN